LINRDLYSFLLKWKDLPTRMPLILRGARQVGKTTLINSFAREFDNYLYFNLEKKADKDLFQGLENLEATIQLLFLTRGIVQQQEKTTLLFIDEVQEMPEVIQSLRYFHEEFKEIHVVVTGSLLEFALEKIQKVPVGRVEYAELHPLSFKEFLVGKGNKAAIAAYDQVPLANNLLPVLFDLFHDYTLIGGMPQITSAYINEKGNLSSVIRLYAGIIESYKSDIEKYASSDSQKQIIRHIIDTAPYEVDNRVKLNNFGNSSYDSRSVKQAMTSLIRARIIDLIYPTTNTTPPAPADLKKRPRLQYLDIGLLNYQLNLHQELLLLSDLNDSSKGKLVQQVVLQELKAQQIFRSSSYPFWVREARGSSSEVDLVYPFMSMLIPVEIKSGASGRLRSLHEFMDRCDHHLAVRIYKGDISIDTLKTRKGKEYKLLNLPYCLSGKLEDYLKWFYREMS